MIGPAARGALPALLELAARNEIDTDDQNDQYHDLAITIRLIRGTHSIAPHSPAGF
jgi:hypothetical protein